MKRNENAITLVLIGATIAVAIFTFAEIWEALALVQKFESLNRVAGETSIVPTDEKSEEGYR